MSALRLLGAFLGTLWALPHSLIGVLMMLIPVWRHPDKGWVWIPYVPRKARIHNWTIHFIAGCMIPPGMKNFRTGAQTHGSLIWFADEAQGQRMSLIRHEERHSRQEWVFGPFYMLLYGGAFLVNLVRFKGDTVQAYKQIPFEVDARKHES